MDDEEGMESFSIDDRDLDWALNPRRQFQSKDQATYGIWAADSDEEEDNRPKFNRRGDRNKPDYSKGVNFVSGGIKQGEKVVKEGQEEEEVEINFSRPSFTAPPMKKQKQAGNNVFAGMRVNSNSAAPDPNKFADWTKHGKGGTIMNMMKKMGYEQGKGLGREGQGIIEPVQAAVRAGRGAVGAYGKEATGPKFGESAADAQRRAAEAGNFSTVDEDEKPVMPKGAWRKNAKAKVTYRTIDDVMADEGSIGMRASKHSGEKVIDMTGPDVREYKGYEALSMKSLRGDAVLDHRKFDIPELSHNLNLIIDLTEEDIRKNTHRMRNLENSSTALRYDLKLAREEMEKEEADLERMQKVYALLDSLQNPSTSMDDFKSAFRRLRSEFTAEYTLLELEKVAVPCILPQIKELFSKWQPLQMDQIAVHLDLVEEWKEILEPPAQANSLFKANTSRGLGGLVDDKLAAFDRLMWDGWMPPVRSAILKWDPRDNMETMMHLVETWLPVMPPWMRDKFIEQLLVPRITTRVEEWDPLTDPKPIHQWLVPWKEVVGDRLLPVFAPIRQKLARALKKWTSTDNSALLILTPWREVWTPATMSAFVQQNIVPKLREGLMQMNLDPSRNAIYKEFTACLSWMVSEGGLISPDVVANLLVESFFPRWYETLCFWLDSPSVVKEEVQTWLREWNGRFPPIMLAFPAVKEWLRRGMLAFAGQRPRGPAPSVAPAPLQAPPPPPPPTIPRGGPDMQLSLKDVLEITARQQGFTHIPQPGRTKDGKQVYWFGTQSIYVDRGLVFVYDMITVEWRPISIHELMSIA